MRDARVAGKRSGRPPSPLIARRARPPSPAPECVTLRDPERVSGGEATADVNETLKMVIEQQRMDHDFLQQLTIVADLLQDELRIEGKGVSLAVLRIRRLR